MIIICWSSSIHSRWRQSWSSSLFAAANFLHQLWMNGCMLLLMWVSSGHNSKKKKNQVDVYLSLTQHEKTLRLSECREGEIQLIRLCYFIHDGEFVWYFLFLFIVVTFPRHSLDIFLIYCCWSGRGRTRRKLTVWLWLCWGKEYLSSDSFTLL